MFWSSFIKGLNWTMVIITLIVAILLSIGILEPNLTKGTHLSLRWLVCLLWLNIAIKN